MSHLTKALRALACYEHDDMSIGDEAADEIDCQQAEIERLRAALDECLTREAKIQKVLDGLNTHLAAWREDY